MNFSIAAKDIFVLNPNVSITKISKYSRAVRDRLAGGEDDFIISEHRSRYSAVRVTADTASFLRRFSSPTTLIKAVLAHSTEVSCEPSDLLEEVYPIVCQLCVHRVLLSPHEVKYLPSGPRFSAGQAIRDYQILACIHATTETELYEVISSNGLPAALKWVPKAAPDFVKAAFEREAEILARLKTAGMTSIPRLISRGGHNGEGDFMILSWCKGRSIYDLAKAEELDLITRAGIALDILSIYVQLHELGFMHGDVHPGNVVADNGISPCLIDFGYGVEVKGSDVFARAGLLTDYEPEAAVQMLEGSEHVPSTLSGEQYCVASMLFLLITGSPCLRLSLESKQALRQIISQPPKSFSELNIYWPEMEKIMSRALAKDPSQRFPSMQSFYNDFSIVVGTGPPTQSLQQPIAATISGHSLTDLIHSMISTYGTNSQLLTTSPSPGPTASIYYGGAGVAYALLRAAMIGESPEALAAADLWIERTVTMIHYPNAFSDPELGLNSTDIGTSALFHTAVGIHAIRAIIRHSFGDFQSASNSVKDCLACIPSFGDAELSAPWKVESAIDLMNGEPSFLVAVTLLHTMCVDIQASLRDSLVRLGDELFFRISTRSGFFNEPGCWSGRRYLGFAHGLAGAIYAILQWSLRLRRPLPKPVWRALDWLAQCSVYDGEFKSWPIAAGEANSGVMTGWCHGSAGHALLWSTAFLVRNNKQYLGHALSASNHLWANRVHSNPSICCGLSGESLVLSEVARISGDSIWSKRARHLLDQAFFSPHLFITPHSLFRGQLGVRLAALELAGPGRPLFPICAVPC